ncbi:MAG: hypothetical protein AB7S26_27580 [Sandaracinaceae bacterium]
MALSFSLALVACGTPSGDGDPDPNPDDRGGSGSEDPPPPRDDPRALGADATFADAVTAARTLDAHRDQDSSAGCLLRRGWRLEADLAVAVRPPPEPAADLDERLGRDGEPVVVLTRWGMYGNPAPGRIALTALTSTMPPRVEPATVLFVTDRGVYVRDSVGRVNVPAPIADPRASISSLGSDDGPVFVTAEAGTPLARVAEILAMLPAASIGRVGLAVPLAENTRLPETPSGDAPPDLTGLCPNGLPPRAAGDPEGNLRPDRIIGALGPLRQAAEICVGTAAGAGAGGGRVVLSFRIAPDGRVSEACVSEEPAPDPSLRECLLRGVRATMFDEPSPAGSVDVALPLVLAPLASQRQRALCD